MENKNNRVEPSRMLQDIVVNQPEQFSNDDLSSPIGAQNSGLCNPHLFPDTIQSSIQTSEVTSFPNGCNDENTLYASNIPFPQNAETNTPHENSIATNITTPGTDTTSKISTSVTATNLLNDVTLSVLFESAQGIRNDFSSSLNVPMSPRYLVPPYLSRKLINELPLSSIPPAVPPIGVIQGLPQYHVDPVTPLTAPPISSIYEDDRLSSVSSSLLLNPSTPRPELHNPKLDYLRDNSMIFSPDAMPQVFNAPELQVLGTENQPMAEGATSTTSLASEITNLDYTTLKVRKLSVEQRRAKINRYLKKRSERNFSKRIKYACRKTLSDSRPRIRGRFAKHDETD